METSAACMMHKKAQKRITDEGLRDSSGKPAVNPPWRRNEDLQRIARITDDHSNNLNSPKSSSQY